MELPVNQILQGDCKQILKTFPSESINMVMFSPPYYGLRDYSELTETVWGGNPNCKHKWCYEESEHPTRGKRNGKGYIDPKYAKKGKSFSKIHYCFCVKCRAWKGQLGLEPDWRMYIDHLVEVFKELKRVIKKTGNIYIVIGDTYAGSMQGYGQKRKSPTGFQFIGDGFYAASVMKPPQLKAKGYKPKCLMGIPWRLAFALIDRLELILRNDIIWHKPNAQPSSVKDRLTQTYEHIFHFVKAKRYYYDLDAIRQPHKTVSPFSLSTKISKRDLEKAQKQGILYKQKFRRNEKGNRLTKRLAYARKVLGKPHDSAISHPLGKNPGDVVASESKFLKYDVKTASPGARGVRTVLEGKLTTRVKRKILEVGAYLKQKRRESGLSFDKLSELTGIKRTTLEHYFRTDFSGQALPDRKTWELLKPILNLGNFDDYISEEIRNALPQPHPLGRNPGDILQANTVRQKSWMSTPHPYTHVRILTPEEREAIGDFWSINTKPFAEAHFAVYPLEICIRPIKSSCPQNGIVLDPMCGSGTTLLAARILGRRYIGIDINPDYVEMAKKRLSLLKKAKILKENNLKLV